MSRTAVDSYPWTDSGNADRLVDEIEGQAIYVASWGKWLIRDYTHWREDDDGAVLDRARRLMRRYLERADDGDKVPSKSLKFALRSEQAPRIHAMIHLATSDRRIAVTHDQLDRDPWLVGVRNGTVDLRTGCLRDAEPGDFITKVVPVEFDPDARCPTWERFLDQIFEGDTDLIRYLQRAIGYSLTGSVSEHVLFLCYGTGANGKTTFLETLRSLAGGYARQASFETFLAKRQGGIPNDVARLHGARLVTASEADSGRRLSESLVKQLTGGDIITARYLHREFFEFVPTFKLWLAANHKPAVYGTDHAIWRRIRLIPFSVTIPKEDQDRDLAEKLRLELPGILVWAVGGCVSWREHKLGDAPAIEKATQAYREEEDVLGEFLAERCVLGVDRWVPVQDLFQAYRDWTEASGGPGFSKTKLGRILSERPEGLQSGKQGGRRVWFGIALRSG